MTSHQQDALPAPEQEHEYEVPVTVTFRWQVEAENEDHACDFAEMEVADALGAIDEIDPRSISITVQDAELKIHDAGERGQ